MVCQDLPRPLRSWIFKASTSLSDKCGNLQCFRVHLPLRKSRHQAPLLSAEEERDWDREPLRGDCFLPPGRPPLGLRLLLPLLLRLRDWEFPLSPLENVPA